MDTEEILSDLEERRDRITKAISLLQGTGRGGQKRKKFSAATRKRMSIAMKRRWASKKKVA
jgi:hypothetical protein